MANILGDNGILNLDVNKIDIPIATVNHLSFYSTVLLKIGDCVKFDFEML